MGAYIHTYNHLPICLFRVLGYRFKGLGFRFQVLGFRVYLNRGVQVSEFRAYVSWFRLWGVEV